MERPNGRTDGRTEVLFGTVVVLPVSRLMRARLLSADNSQLTIGQLMSTDILKWYKLVIQKVYNRTGYNNIRMRLAF